jgi:hypothetical protein
MNLFLTSGSPMNSSCLKASEIKLDQLSNLLLFEWVYVTVTVPNLNMSTRHSDECTTEHLITSTLWRFGTVTFCLNSALWRFVWIRHCDVRYRCIRHVGIRLVDVAPFEWPRFFFIFNVANLPKIKHSFKETAIWTDVAFDFMPGA